MLPGRQVDGIRQQVIKIILQPQKHIPVERTFNSQGYSLKNPLFIASRRFNPCGNRPSIKPRRKPI